jgi:hypothetical protein
MPTGMKRTITLAAVLSFTLLCASIARSAEFTADVDINQNGALTSGTAYVKDGNVRYELMTGAGGQVIIYRADFGAQWTIFSSQEGVYDEEWDSDDEDFIMQEVDPRLIGIATDELLGTETVGGLDCDIHYYRYDNPARGTLTVWRARELDYPVKIELKTRDYFLTKEYRNIKTDRLNDSLFELPKGYKMLK